VLLKDEPPACRRWPRSVRAPRLKIKCILASSRARRARRNSVNDEGIDEETGTATCIRGLFRGDRRRRDRESRYL